MVSRRLLIDSAAATQRLRIPRFHPLHEGISRVVGTGFLHEAVSGSLVDNIYCLFIAVRLAIKVVKPWCI
jgi:hypothetical protein